MTSGVEARHDATGPVELAGFARPRLDEAISGDVFAWIWSPTCVTLLLADGLGHGEHAREAADRAVALLVASPDLAVDDLLRRCHLALVRTRGAAIAVVRVQPEQRRLSFVGVGNIRIWSDPPRMGRGTSIPGVVGMRMPPALRVFESFLEADDLLLFYTDGVDGGFDPKRLRGAPFADVPATVTREHGLGHDDATVVALRLRGTVGES